MYSLCCISNILAAEGRKFRTLRYKRFNELGREAGLRQLGEVILNNVSVTYDIIRYCYRMGLAYRISSSIFPLITYDKAAVELKDLPTAKEIFFTLREIASFVDEHKFHLSVHPDQFHVLESANPIAVESSIKGLNFLGWVMDTFGCPRDISAPMNVHVICSDPDPTVIVTRFMEAFNRCDESVKSRLVLENSDKGYWNCKNLYKYFHLYTGEKIRKTFCFDV